MPTSTKTGPISLARKMEVCMVLSLRRHDPDQVRRVTALPKAGGISAPWRGSPRNLCNVSALKRVSTRLRDCDAAVHKRATLPKFQHRPRLQPLCCLQVELRNDVRHERQSK